MNKNKTDKQKIAEKPKRMNKNTDGHKFICGHAQQISESSLPSINFLCEDEGVKWSNIGTIIRKKLWKKSHYIQLFFCVFLFFGESRIWGSGTLVGSGQTAMSTKQKSRSTHRAAILCF